MKISDLIFQEINEMLAENGGSTRIQRNELAERLGCVPSQINYVITSRFTTEHGYLVESRRGGGGFIRIVKVQAPRQTRVFHVLQSIGDAIDERSARMMLENLTVDGVFSAEEARLMIAALSDQNFRGLPEESRRVIRANLMKSMLLATAQAERGTD